MSDASRKIDAPEGQATGTKTSKPFESAIIPSSFWLGGLKIDVSYDENLHKNRRIVGEARYPSQSIVLDSVILSKQLMEQNFFHELTHWILYVMNEDDLRNNEKFVDVFAYFMHQALVTRQWETSVSQETDGVAATQKEQILDS
jgi:hypothetical protein